MNGTKTWRQRLHDFAYYRSRPLRGWIKHTLKRPQVDVACRRLHVGCGMQRLDGWLNVDLLKWPEVDLRLDVTRGLPFSELTHVFAEHFLEHLAVDQALDFLVSAHGCLAPEGRLRLSTPNLDWVWSHVYDPRPTTHDTDEASRETMAMRANRSFYGWGHRFIWNRPLLSRALGGVGFVDLSWCHHGESSDPELRNLERHETYEDTSELPHVLIVEARKGEPRTADLEALRRELRHEFLRYVED